MTQKASKEQHKNNNVLCTDCQQNIQECLEGRFCQKCSQFLDNPQLKLVSDSIINIEKRSKINDLIPQREVQNEQLFQLRVKRSRPAQEILKISERCRTCNKKVGIFGYKCGHCCIDYCKNHRLPQNHQCQVDFVSLGRKKLKLQNPIVRSSKIQAI